MIVCLGCPLLSARKVKPDFKHESEADHPSTPLAEIVHGHVATHSSTIILYKMFPPIERKKITKGHKRNCTFGRKIKPECPMACEAPLGWDVRMAWSGSTARHGNSRCPVQTCTVKDWAAGEFLATLTSNDSNHIFQVISHRILQLYM